MLNYVHIPGWPSAHDPPVSHFSCTEITVCVTRPGKWLCFLSSLEETVPFTSSTVPNRILESVLTKQGTSWARRKGQTQNNGDSKFPGRAGEPLRFHRTHFQNTADRDKRLCVVLDVWVDHLHPISDSKHCLEFIWTPATLLGHIFEQTNKQKTAFFPRSGRKSY